MTNLFKIASKVILIGIVRLLVGGTSKWATTPISGVSVVYYANHSSHLDTLVIWAALPDEVRAKTKPVAAYDYWGSGILKKFIALDVLNSLLINREVKAGINPLLPLISALKDGSSLILFPEGTRGYTDTPCNFKSGIYHLALSNPSVKFVPVYLDTLHRSMPKGALFPVPFICTAYFGDAISLNESESKQQFLDRARKCLLDLKPRSL